MNSLYIRVSDIPTIFGYWGQDNQHNFIEAIQNGQKPNFKKQENDFTKNEIIIADTLKYVDTSITQDILENKKTIQQSFTQITDLSELPEKLYEKTQTIFNDNNKSILEKQKEINRCIEKQGFMKKEKMECIQDTQIDKDLKEKIQMDKGTVSEKKGLELFSQTIGLPIQTKEFVYKRKYLQHNDISICLNGKYDGLISPDILVEHKERNYPRTHKITEKEKAQLFGYFLLYNKTKGYIVSTYNSHQMYEYIEATEEEIEEFKIKLFSFFENKKNE